MLAVVSTDLGAYNALGLDTSHPGELSWARDLVHGKTLLDEAEQVSEDIHSTLAFGLPSYCGLWVVDA